MRVKVKVFGCGSFEFGFGSLSKADGDEMTPSDSPLEWAEEEKNPRCIKTERSLDQTAAESG